MGTLAGSGGYVARGVYYSVWSGLKSGASVGSWAQLPQTPDRSVEFSGTWGAGGATVILEGTNTLASMLTTGTKAFAINDSRGVGNAISTATGKLFQILENVANVRPRITVNGSASVVTLTCRIISESRLR